MMLAVDSSKGFFSPNPHRPDFAQATERVRVPKLPRAHLSALREQTAAALAASDPELEAKMAQPPSPEQRLLMRATMGWSLADQAHVDDIGYDAWLEEQLAPETLDDSFLEEALVEALPSLDMSAQEIVNTYVRNEEPLVPAYELLAATLFRAIYSPRQLLERMVVFWTDQFNIDLFSDYANFLKPVDDREVIRRHALGTFPELLRASAASPAMLIYLSNAFSNKEHPNENYAREVMELHSIGFGHTQEDVREVSRAFTGWTIQGRDIDRAGFGTFRFEPRIHDYGEKTVLGETIPARSLFDGGIEDGERVIEILVNHPNTATNLASRMLGYFWGYNPGPGKVARVAKVYEETGGDIRAMLREVLRRPWISRASYKLKRPFLLVTSALRALGAEIERPFFLLASLEAAGHLPFTWGPPDGFPDTESYWSGFVLPRWGFAAEMPFAAVRLDDPAFDPEQDPRLTPNRARALISRTLSNNTFSPQTKKAHSDYLKSVDFNVYSVKEALGLGVASPEFQLY